MLFSKNNGYMFAFLLIYAGIKTSFTLVESLQYSNLNPSLHNQCRPAIIRLGLVPHYRHYSQVATASQHMRADRNKFGTHPCKFSPLNSESENANNAAESSSDIDDSNAKISQSLPTETTSIESSPPSTGDKKSFLTGLKFWNKNKNNNDDSVPFKVKLRKAGLAVLLSYGFVSNMSYSVTVSLAWYGFNKKTGLSPLAPGQWKGFLAVYAGFYVFNNFVRPARFTLSLGVAKYFDSATLWIQDKFRVSKKVAIGVLVFLANFCGTLAAMSFGIWLASIASGVSIFPPKI